jgi:hypothetical protein
MHVNDKEAWRLPTQPHENSIRLQQAICTRAELLSLPQPFQKASMMLAYHTIVLQA